MHHKFACQNRLGRGVGRGQVLGLVVWIDIIKLSVQDEG